MITLLLDSAFIGDDKRQLSIVLNIAFFLKKSRRFKLIHKKYFLISLGFFFVLL